MMKVDVQLFARARELAGVCSIRIELPQEASVADLRKQLASEHPELASLLERSALAVDNEFASEDLRLTSRASVALIPPVSGGGV